MQSCGTKYYGYIYDFDNETPLNKVKVYSTDSLNYILSNKKGYFEIDFNKDLKHLTFSKKGYRKFNLRTLSIQSGEFMKELPFGDTIYLISKNSKYSRPKTTLPNKIPLIKTGFIQAVNGELYKVFVNAINTTENAIAPLSTKFVTNGSPGRSRNWELSRILYFNIGYLDFSSWYNLSSDWRYRSLTFATDLFRETSAHEIGHEVLLAYGGHIYSKKHKETSTILQSENAGLKYPSGEIDLMKYFDEVYAPDFRKVIVSEKDVLSLIWLTKLELK
ncbi:hypothetical protein [Tenacibaculum maritimum]|uniref:hypothetical protein n=1 Tax=Tenacibaculum maritimum TaxID=107401 RepID=UPI00132F8537|nr:hypothetical protein [Tenacibaculum maritimum]